MIKVRLAHSSAEQSYFHGEQTIGKHAARDTDVGVTIAGEYRDCTISILVEQTVDDNDSRFLVFALDVDEANKFAIELKRIAYEVSAHRERRRYFDTVKRQVSGRNNNLTETDAPLVWHKSTD